MVLPCVLTAASATATARHGMVAAAHPLAAEAGVEVLKAGGNALDAAIATAFTLDVVEPYASGMGGGGFLVYFNAATGEVSAYDYRETAPAGLTDDVARSGNRYRRNELRYGGLSVAVPGMLRGLHTAHSKYGQKPFGELLNAAIHYAESGYEVSEELSGHISDKMDLLQANEAAAAIFLEDGIFPLAPGSRIVQADLAGFLRQIQQHGPDAFYSGENAERIAKAVRDAGGVMTAEDLAGYRHRDATVIRTQYRGYELASIGPPSGGGLTVMKTLRLLEDFAVGSMKPGDPMYWALLTGAMEQAYQSTMDHVADPRFVRVDVAGMLSDDWKAAAIQRMKTPRGAPTTECTDPGDSRAPMEEGSGNTTHFSVIDKDGNMVAITQTINHFFASGVVVPGLGLLLNNEIDDFTFNTRSVNRPEPGKIPRSSMSPTLVFRDGKSVATLGTPGGTRIPAALTQILINRIDFGMSLPEAIDAPRVFLDVGRQRLHFENRDMTGRLEAAMKLLGEPAPIELNERSAYDRYFGGAQGIWIHFEEDGTRTLVGAADPRRGGAAHGY
jgi:gamma-glutamyltranspeptidase / glutathione hydrolase